MHKIWIILASAAIACVSALIGSEKLRLPPQPLSIQSIRTFSRKKRHSTFLKFEIIEIFSYRMRPVFPMFDIWVLEFHSPYTLAYSFAKCLAYIGRPEKSLP